MSSGPSMSSGLRPMRSPAMPDGTFSASRASEKAELAKPTPVAPAPKLCARKCW